MGHYGMTRLTALKFMYIAQQYHRSENDTSPVRIKLNYNGNAELYVFCS